MCVYVVEDGWGRGGRVHMSLMVMVGELGWWGSWYGVTVSRRTSGLALLAGRDLTLTASQPELSDEV